MTSFAELGATAAFICTASTTMGVGGYANMRKSCVEGVFKRKPRHQRSHHLDPPHHDELVNCPLKDVVPVTIDGSSVGNREISFNGEILSVASSAAGRPEPSLALGGCDVQVNDCRVVATPPELPTIELCFSNPQDARRWAKEFKEGSQVGEPHNRVQELISHSLRVEKHVLDLRKRSERALDVDKQNEKLKKELRLVRCGFDGGDNSAPSTSTQFAGWLTGANDKAAMQEELQRQKAELELAQKSAERLKNTMAEHARSDTPAAARWRSLSAQLLQLSKAAGEDAGALEPKAMQPVQQEKEESRTAEEVPRRQEATESAASTLKAEAPDAASMTLEAQDAAKLEEPASSAALEPKFDPKREAKLAPSEKPPVAAGRTVPRQATQETRAHERLAQETKQERMAQVIEQRFKEIESRLSYSRLSAQTAPALRDAAPQPDSTSGRLVAAVSQVNAFKSLEERIRCHQMLVNQDCDVLQQAMRGVCY